MVTTELIKEAAAGDSTAFADIVTKFSRLVFALCLARTGDHDDAEDLTQDVFVKVYQRLPTVKDPEKFVGWLRRVTVNTCNTWARERRTTLSLDEVEEEAVDDPTSVRPKRETQVTVADALKSVSANSRVVLALHYVGGYSYQEIARLLELPVATVRSRLREGRQQMKRELLKVIKQLLQLRLSSDELAEQVIARCGNKTCTCPQELLNP